MRPSARAALCGAIVGLGLAGGPPAAAAQPTVRVRAEARIELRTVREPSGARIEGVLRDDLGQALPRRAVRLRVRQNGRTAVDQTVRTDEEGTFRVPLGLAQGDYRLTAEFPGDRTHERAQVRRRLDLDRADVRLEVGLPAGGRLDLDEPEHTIEVRARSSAGGEGLRVELRDELGRRLAEIGVTGADGVERFVVPTDRLGPPGPGRVKARSFPDDRRAEAQTEVPVVRFRQTRLTLQASSERARPGDELVLRGRLTDSAGPLDGRAVGLFALGADGREHLATVLTDGAGRYRHELSLRSARRGELRIRARFDSDTPGRVSSASEPIVVGVGTGEGGWTWLLAPIVLCALALGWLARRSPAPAARASAPPPPRTVGVEAAGRSARRADRHDVAGRVLDHRDDEPLPGAMVTLVGADGGALPVATDGAGGFAAQQVPAGEWTLRIEAEGYFPTEAAVRVPHRGEWSSARVRLESLRARALAPFRKVALALLPSSSLWGLRTNREIVGEARASGRAHAELEALAQRVEQACYGPTPPAHADVEAIEHEADRLLDRLAEPDRR